MYSRCYWKFNFFTVMQNIIFLELRFKCCMLPVRVTDSKYIFRLKNILIFTSRKPVLHIRKSSVWSLSKTWIINIWFIYLLQNRKNYISYYIFCCRVHNFCWCISFRYPNYSRFGWHAGWGPGIWNSSCPCVSDCIWENIVIETTELVKIYWHIYFYFIYLFLIFSSSTVNRVDTYKELDSDLFKHATFATLDDVSLRLLIKSLNLESEIKEVGVLLNCEDYLFTGIGFYIINVITL